MRTIIILLIAILCLTLSPTLVSAQDSPSLPCRFYGEVLLNSTPVADGTVITVIIQDDVYTTMTPAAEYGNSWYAIMIIPPEGTTYNDGITVTFIIDRYYAFETGTWQNGLNIRLNLTASTTLSPTITPSPTPTPELTPTPETSPTSTPEITPAPAISLTPAPPVNQINTVRLVGLIIFGVIAVLLLAVLIYLIWRFFLRRQEQP